MSGSRAGGLRAAETNSKKYGQDFYKKIGAKGGLVSHPDTRHFYIDREMARIAGARGGRVSKRTKIIKVNEED